MYSNIIVIHFVFLGLQNMQVILSNIFTNASQTDVFKMYETYISTGCM